ncbi:Trimethyllysine dioxygenase [Lentinula raphanica]|nr:Trimethyllysine dioxygenase [Lentinula raphanica]
MFSMPKMVLNRVSSITYIWLRDHCECERCVHPVTKQRMVDTFRIPTGIKPVRIEERGKEGVMVVWPEESGEEHVSVYGWNWLKGQTSRKVERVLWDSSIGQSAPRHTYGKIIDGVDGEQGLLRLLSDVETYGFSFVDGVPVNTTSTESLIRRIGYIRQTQYGAFWEFTSDMEKGDTAYSNLGLDVHTDNTYFTDPSGLQIFHLLETGIGGQTILVDGFNAASKLEPSSYSLLSQVPIPFHASGDSTYIFQSSFPILTHSLSDLVQVRWNNYDRGVLPTVPALYQSLAEFHSLLSSPRSQYTLQLQPGTVLIINNHRVLHGRTAFEGRRRMCGAYVGKDEWTARLSRLRNMYGKLYLPESTKVYHLWILTLIGSDRHSLPFLASPAIFGRIP